MTHLARLFRHMWWADDAVRAALEAAGDRAPDRAVALYAHVLGAELVWLDRVEGAAPSVAVWPETSLAGCAALARRARERYETFLGSLTAEALPRPIHYTNSAGQAFDTPLEDILLHVALHGAYHRGQIAMLLRDAGAEPAPTDYIAWARGVPAATRR